MIIDIPLVVPLRSGPCRHSRRHALRYREADGQPGVPFNLVTAYPDDYAEGETIVWWPFSSTTTKISVLQDALFLGLSGTHEPIHTRNIAASGLNQRSFTIASSKNPS